MLMLLQHVLTGHPQRYPSSISLHTSQFMGCELAGVLQLGQPFVLARSFFLMFYDYLRVSLMIIIDLFCLMQFLTFHVGNDIIVASKEDRPKSKNRHCCTLPHQNSSHIHFQRLIFSY